MTMLRVERVDEDVEERRPHGQYGGQEVDGAPEEEEGGHLEGEGEAQRRRHRHLARHQRAVAGPGHDGVDVPVHDHVERVGAAGGQGPADEGPHHQPEGRQTGVGHHHRGQRGDEEELDDPGLGEGQVGGDPGPRDTRDGDLLHRSRA
jgi:hypothetical protein